MSRKFLSVAVAVALGLSSAAAPALASPKGHDHRHGQSSSSAHHRTGLHHERSGERRFHDRQYQSGHKARRAAGQSGLWTPEPYPGGFGQPLR